MPHFKLKIMKVKDDHIMLINEEQINHYLILNLSMQAILILIKINLKVNLIQHNQKIFKTKF